MLGSQLTDVPGSSKTFLGGWITYADAMKTGQLSVPAQLLEQHGAVSEPVARAMANAARQHSDADHAVAITGIAGPDGATTDKPIGTVYLALASRDQPTDAYLAKLIGNRHAVRLRATFCALQLLRLAALDQESSQIQWLEPLGTPAHA